MRGRKLKEKEQERKRLMHDKNAYMAYMPKRKHIESGGNRIKHIESEYLLALELTDFSETPFFYEDGATFNKFIYQSCSGFFRRG